MIIDILSAGSIAALVLIIENLFQSGLYHLDISVNRKYEDSKAGGIKTYPRKRWIKRSLLRVVIQCFICAFISMLIVSLVTWRCEKKIDSYQDRLESIHESIHEISFHNEMDNRRLESLADEVDRLNSIEEDQSELDRAMALSVVELYSNYGRKHRIPPIIRIAAAEGMIHD